MAKALLLQGGGDGGSLDGVTAKAADVLAGTYTVTVESDGEVVQGTMVSQGAYTQADSIVTDNNQAYVRVPMGAYVTPTGASGFPELTIPFNVLSSALRVEAAKMLQSLMVAGVRGTIVDHGNGMPTIELVNAAYESKFYARMEPGYYQQAGQWKPWVSIPYDTFAAVAGVDPAKMLQSLTVAGRQGQIPDRGSFIRGTNPWYYWDGGELVAAIPTGYYGAGNGSGGTNVTIPKDAVKGALGLNPDYWLDNFNTMGFQGTIPRWVCNTTDILETTQAFAYNDAANGRGQGIVMAIKNGHRIEGANWIFMREPNLQPPNIKAGVSIAGVTGAMQDYGAGGAVFHNATFNGTFSSGVADKGLGYGNILCMPHWNAWNRFHGLADGGLKYTISDDGPNKIVDLTTRSLGSSLLQSINCAPFRAIEIDYTVRGHIYTFINPKAVILRAYITSIQGFQRNQVTIDGALRQYLRVSRLIKTATREIARGVDAPRQTAWVDNSGTLSVDVSAINEHAFVTWGIGTNFHETGASQSIVTGVDVVIKAIRLVK